MRASLALLVIAGCGAPPEHAEVTNHSTAISSPCAKLAAKLAPIPGEKDGGGGRAGREPALAKMCTDQHWPARVTDCVVTADHDPLSCLGYLEGDAKTAWSATFDAWYMTER